MTPSPVAPAALIDSDHAAFMQAGMSINIGSCGADLEPNAVRALGCRISSDRRRVTLFVSAVHAARVIADIAANGRIAVVFSQPSTHRTVQLKGDDAVCEAPLPDDLERVARYRQAFLDELAGIGFDRKMASAFLACPDEEITAIAFTPDSAFNQTPGPKAGASLGGQA